MLTAKDVIVYKLTGRMCTDYSDASGYMAYNYRAKQWDREMIEACGLKYSLFPEIVSGIAVAGYVTKEAAEACGLAEGTPVVLDSYIPQYIVFVNIKVLIYCTFPVVEKS